MNNIFEVSNISKRYESFSISNLSFEIPKGYITGVIGANGAGKTTTIKGMLSQIKTDSGYISYNGDGIDSFSYLQDIGFIMDEPFLSKDWDMLLVERAMATGYKNWERDKFFHYLELFDVNFKLRVKELSRGMKIKLMLSVALSHNAETLVLDEPTSGLDPGMRDELTDILKSFVENENHTVIFSTHITQDLEAIADYIVFIMDGQLIVSCSKDDFMDKYLLVKGFPEQLSEIAPDYIIGSKLGSVGFEALISAENAAKLSQELDFEKPSIDKIMIHYGRR